MCIRANQLQKLIRNNSKISYQLQLLTQVLCDLIFDTQTQSEGTDKLHYGDTMIR